MTLKSARPTSPLSLLLLLPGLAANADTYPVDANVDVLHYRFSIELSDETDAIEGIADIRVHFADAGAKKLRLDLIGKTDEESDTGMVVSTVSMNDTALTFEHDNYALTIELPESLESNETLAFRIEYAGSPATGFEIGDTKYGDRSFFSDNWPDKARHWLPTVDHISDKATSEFLVTAPAHYQVVSNGLLQEETDLGGGLRLTHWKQSLPTSPWLYMLGVAEFAVQQVDTFDGKAIQTWVYRQDRDAGFYDFAVPTREALDYFSDFVGPFVYEKLANIQSNSVGGGMEAASAILYGDDSVTGERTPRWRYVIVHEIAHQWFGNSVTEATWDDVWLSEGFATYFSYLFYEHTDGRDVFIDNMKMLKGRIFEFHEENPDYRIVHDNLDDMSKVTTRQTYDKGAWILHMLRETIGDEAWWQGVRSYYAAHMNSHATTDDFRREMEASCECDLKLFFDQWLYQGGNLFLTGEWRYDDERGTVDVTLTQPQFDDSSYSTDVGIGLYADDEGLPDTYTLSLSGRSAELSIPVEGKPAAVRLDPRTALLAQWTFTESNDD